MEQSKLNYKLAIVASRFNEEVTQRLLDGAIARLKELNFEDEKVNIVSVPGAIEIPVVAQRLARTKDYAAIICLGAVIRGETTHYDYVCDQVSMGCQRVAIDESLPVVFGVLTTENEEQAFERLGGSHGHKGRDAVDTAIEMVSVLNQVS